MKEFHLLGSEGFIGRAIQREALNLSLTCWTHSSNSFDRHFDLYDRSTWDSLISQNPKSVILLSWPGLPNYNDSFHLSRNLPASIELIEELINVGLKNLIIAGTCYEYGLQCGELQEDDLTDPINCYSMAKDSLRRFTENICIKHSVRWCWLRVFYPYGQGQNINSLLPSLDRAIDDGESLFKMSSGRQIRDFLPVESVAKHILLLAQNQNASGVFNSCSGEPRSLREMVEQRIKQRNSDIQVKLGHYPDRLDEPLAFWGCPNRINKLKNDC